MLSHSTFKFWMEKIAAATSESQQDKFKKRLEVYYEVLSPLFGDQQFAKACSHLLKKSNGKFPSIEMVIEVAHIFSEAKTGSGEKCEICDGSGIITAYKDKMRFAFKCNKCHNCTYNYPVWNSRFFDSGYEPRG